MQIETEMAALRRLARALTADHDEADDLVQDTLLAAIRHRPAETAPVRPWLAAVLRRRRISLLRSTRRESARIAALPEADTSRSPEAAQIVRELAEEVARLGADERRLLELRFGEGYTTRECAEALGREPSTVRTQLARALQRLRARLDRRDGGRRAWMPALVAIGGAGDRAVAAPLVLGPKSLGVGAVLAATTLWLGAAVPNGCGTTIESGSADPGASSQHDDAPAAPKSASSPTPKSSSKSLSFALGGPDPDDDDDVTKWGADPSQENAEGAVHPLLAVTMAMRGMYNRVGRCVTTGRAASVRSRLTIRFDPDGSTAFESVEFSRIAGLDEAALECIRQTIIAREIQVRRVDVTMLGFPAGTTLESFRSADLRISADGEVETSSVEEQPRTSILGTGERDALRLALDSCGAGPVTIDVTFDPKTFALASATPTGDHADDAQGRCVAALVTKRTNPTHAYEPRVPADSQLHCTFGVESELGPYTCEQAGPPASHVPRSID